MIIINSTFFNLVTDGAFPMEVLKYVCRVCFRADFYPKQIGYTKLNKFLFQEDNFFFANTFL